MRLLQGHTWPGNVRELFGVLESAHIQARGHRIEAQHLPAEVRGQGGSAPSPERYRLERPSEDERTSDRPCAYGDGRRAQRGGGPTRNEPDDAVAQDEGVRPRGL